MRDSMRLVVLLTALTGGACTAELAASEPLAEVLGDAAPPSEAPSTEARRAFDESVAPLLDDRCRFCHGDPAMAPAFLLGQPDLYTTVTTWPALVDRDVPEDSRLLTKGEHDGPEWADGESAIVLTWLELERAPDAADDAPVPPTEAPPPGDPCGRLDAFTTLAAAPLEASCATCHGGDDGPATAALDLRGVSDAAASARAAACARVLPSLDLARPMASPLFTEVNPRDDAEHPFRFGGDVDEFRAFRSAILQWIVDRQVDP